jgi:hypothetical protein
VWDFVVDVLLVVDRVKGDGDANAELDVVVVVVVGCGTASGIVGAAEEDSFDVVDATLGTGSTPSRIDDPDGSVLE